MAEDAPPAMLEAIVIAASPIPFTLSKTTNNTNIINREMIEARQATSVVDLLRLVPGLHIDQAGGRGGVSSLYLRGSDPNFTLVLIDGIKMNDPTNSRGGSFDLSTLDVNSIEKIEIIRGPLSSVYGSDAMGGVINIVTRAGSASPEITLDVGFGTDAAYRAGLETRGTFGSADYRFSLSGLDDGSPVAGSEFIGKNMSAKISVSPSNRTWIELVSRYSDSHSESFPDDSGGPRLAVLRSLDQRDTTEFTLGMILAHDFRPWWRSQLKSNFYLRKEEHSSPGVAPGLRDPFGIPPNSSDNQFKRSNLVLDNRFEPFSAMQVNLGIDFQVEEGTSDSLIDFGGGPIPGRFKAERKILAAFFESQYNSGIGFIIEGGLRIDDAEGFESELSPRIGLLYRIDATQTSLRANWGEGFKLPSFFALGNPIVGNADLVPETSESFELGFVQDLFSGQSRLSGNYFKNRFFNLIDFDEGPPPQLVNRSRVETEGLEIEFSVQATAQVSIASHLNYTKTDIIGTSEALRNRPKWRGGMTTFWQAQKNLNAKISILHVGKIHDSAIATGDVTLNAYLRVDATANWTIHESWRLSLTIDNLFDADYEEAIGFPSPGIRGFLLLRLIL